jgi:3-oxoacyl-[acyl-carrier protein] reductase
MARLAGRVAVVTGGGSGIGAAIARRFAAEGARVAIADVSRDGGDRTAASIRDAGGSAIAVPTDVADSAQVDALFARVVREWGTVDILSNNAGIGELSPVLRAQIDGAVAGMLGGGERRSLGVTSRMDDAEWRRMVEIHLFGTFYCTRAALRIMEERGTGRSSTWRPSPAWAASPAPRTTERRRRASSASRSRSRSRSAARTSA